VGDDYKIFVQDSLHVRKCERTWVSAWACGLSPTSDLTVRPDSLHPRQMAGCSHPQNVHKFSSLIMLFLTGHHAHPRLWPFLLGPPSDCFCPKTSPGNPFSWILPYQKTQHCLNCKLYTCY